MSAEREAEAKAREAVLNASVMCAECGHGVAFHGDGHEDSCTEGGCLCPRNAAQAYADGKLSEATLDAYAATITARVKAECGQAALEAETKRADVMGEVWEAGRAIGRREMDAEWRARVEGAKRYDPFKPMGPDDYTMQQVPDGEWIIRRDLLAARCEAHGVIECYCLTAALRGGAKG